MKPTQKVVKLQHQRHSALRTAFCSARWGNLEQKKAPRAESAFGSQRVDAYERKRRGRLSEWPSTHASWLAPTPTPTLYQFLRVDMQGRMPCALLVQCKVGELGTKKHSVRRVLLVVVSGLEPPTPTLSGWCSNRLSYTTILNCFAAYRFYQTVPHLRRTCLSAEPWRSVSCETSAAGRKL